MTCDACSLKCIASDCDCLCHDIDRLEAKNKRLREALETIRDRGSFGNGIDMDIAKKALEVK